LENLKEVLEGMFKGAVIQGAQMTGINTNQLIPIFLEYIAYQMYQLAPLELEEWIKLIPDQCRTPNDPLPEMCQAREDLMLTLELVTNT